MDEEILSNTLTSRKDTVNLLSSLANIVNDLKDMINKGLITKEEVISMFTDKPGH